MKLKYTLLTVVGVMACAPLFAEDTDVDVRDSALSHDELPEVRKKKNKYSAYASFYDTDSDRTYTAGSNFIFNVAAVTPAGIKVDSTGTKFTVSCPGIYFVSFLFKSLLTASIPLVEVMLNGQITGLSGFSAAEGMINVTKANSVITINNTASATVGVGVLNIIRIA